MCMGSVAIFQFYIHVKYALSIVIFEIFTMYIHIKYALTSCNCEYLALEFSKYIRGQMTGYFLQIFGGKLGRNSFGTESEIFEVNVQVVPLI